MPGGVSTLALVSANPDLGFLGESNVMKIIDWLHTVLRGEEDETGPDGGSSLYGLSVAEALQAHRNWIRRFEGALSQGGEDLNPEEIAHDDRCILGRWILSQKTSRSALARLPLFEELRTTHTAFHKTASLLAESVCRKEAQESRLLFEVLRQKSRAIRIALARLIIEAQDRVAI